MEDYKTIFYSLYPKLVVYCRKFLPSLDEAEDEAIISIQAAFKIYKNFKDLESLRVYVYIVAKNRCLNVIKLNKRKYEKEELYLKNEQLETIEIEYELFKAPIIAIIHKHVEELPDKCKEVFKLLYFEDYDTNQVAKLLDISIETVYSQKRIAIQKLRLKLDTNTNPNLLI